MNPFELVSKIKIDLKELLEKIDGRIDGHLWGEEQTGKNFVSINDLQEIHTELEKIYEKYFS